MLFAADKRISGRFRRLMTLYILFAAACLVWFAWHEDFPRMIQSAAPFTAELNVDASWQQHPARSCDQECLSFRNVLSNWPPDKPKAAVYYLAKTSRLHLLNDSLASLQRNFLDQFDYPVIVFHETDARDLLHGTFRKEHADIRLFFQEVQFNTPDHVNASLDKLLEHKRYPVGYRHMCRFHAKEVYQQEILVGLEYAWRLDDESLLLETVNYDLFAFMKSHRFQYGYIRIWNRTSEYYWTKGLWEAADLYKNTRHLESRYFDEWTDPIVFYNNFEISALSLWKSQQYQDYINYIDLLGGIYYNRWGDAPIKTIAVTLFLREQDVHMFANVSYQHKGFYYPLENTTARPDEVTSPIHTADVNATQLSS